MKKLRDYLKEVNAEQYHIFDSHQEQLINRGMYHKDQDFIAYSYNIHKNNKPKAGDLFLYRRPGKSTTNRRFNIYGGGVIDYITEPDVDGNVFAMVKLPFKLKEPLEQKTSEFLENFQWNFKQKKSGSWEHFWNQYGMNVIEGQDFWGLVGEQEYIVPDNTNLSASYVKEAAEEFIEVERDIDIQGFRINFAHEEEQKLVICKEGAFGLTDKHTDYKKLQAVKTTVGKVGEYLVLELLRERYKDTEARVEHMAEIEGGGCGYDIRITFSDKKELFIEVKTTTSSYLDGFYLTSCERRIAKQCCLKENSKNKSYHIYRVYNFDLKNKTADIKIFENFNDRDFRLAPTCWKVHIR